MKAKKRERQSLERLQNGEQKRQDFLNNLKTVELVLRTDSPIQYERVFSWMCPDCQGHFSYSQKINDMWGHSHKFVFCAVCKVYHKFDYQKLGLILE
jgi:hypothetical protein